MWDSLGLQRVLFLISLQCHRAQQSRFDRLGIFGEHIEAKNIVGFCNPFFFGLVKIADDAVRPEIDDVYFQHVAGGLHRFGDIHAPRKAPKDAEFLAVEPDFGNFFDIAQVEKEPFGLAVRFFRGPGCGAQVKCFPVSGLARIKFDSFFGAASPAGQFWKLGIGWTAPGRIERDVPRAAEILQLGELGEITFGFSRNLGGNQIGRAHV